MQTGSSARRHPPAAGHAGMSHNNPLMATLPKQAPIKLCTAIRHKTLTSCQFGGNSFYSLLACTLNRPNGGKLVQHQRAGQRRALNVAEHPFSLGERLQTDKKMGFLLRALLEKQLNIKHQSVNHRTMTGGSLLTNNSGVIHTA